MAGWGRLRGPLQVPLRGPAQPQAAVRSGACEAVLRKQSALTHVSSVAASMRLTPPPPDPPCLRQFSAICRNAWPALGGCRPWSTRRSTPCVDALRSIVEIIDFNGDSSTHGVDLPPSPEIRRGWGGVGWQDRWRHGWRHRAPMDGFTACPANPHHPSQQAKLPEPAVVVASAGAGPQALPTHPIPRPGSPRSVSAHRSARDAACPSASAAPAAVHPPACPATGPAGCAPASADPAADR